MRFFFSKKFLILLTISFFLGGVGYLLLFSSSTRITNIQIEGANVVSHEDIERIVREEMAQSVIGLLSKSASVLFPTNNVLISLQAAFPRLDTISVHKVFPNDLFIGVTEREVDGIWCISLTDRNCSFFDNQGVIFEQAPSSTRGFLLFQVDDNRAYTEVPMLGATVLDESLLEFLTFLRDGITFRKLAALRYYIMNEKEVRVNFKGGWEAIFSTEQNPIYQVEVLDRVLTKEIEDDLPLLDYVDLRVKNKVFYSFRES